MIFEFEDGMEDFIKDYIDCENGDYDCKNCSNNDECYMEANAICNHEFAESIGYGGYDSEDEFWESLYD